MDKIDVFNIEPSIISEGSITKYKYICKNLVNKEEGNQFLYATLEVLMIKMASFIKNKDEIVVGEGLQVEDLILVSYYIK